jgi:hypothetical protein
MNLRSKMFHVEHFIVPAEAHNRKTQFPAAMASAILSMASRVVSVPGEC